MFCIAQIKLKDIKNIHLKHCYGLFPVSGIIEKLKKQWLSYVHLSGEVEGAIIAVIQYLKRAGCRLFFSKCKQKMY